LEHTVVLIKPDGVKRAHIGEVIGRFERMGLKIVAMKMVWASYEDLGKHYTDKKEYLINIGKKTLKTYEEYGLAAKEGLGTTDPFTLGKMIREWTINYVGSGPVVAILLEGRHAVDNVRSLAGPTMPVNAPAGTIRGDLATDSAAYANLDKRAVENIVHISGSVEEANLEEKLWFHKNEIHNYKKPGEG